MLASNRKSMKLLVSYVFPIDHFTGHLPIFHFITFDNDITNVRRNCNDLIPFRDYLQITSADTVLLYYSSTI